ncbi:MAG: phage vB BhaS71 [Actinomycetota bacterium]
MGSFRLEDYEPVESRIRAFWMKYPNGRLLTDLQRTERPDGRIEWICRTEAFTKSDDVRPQATGFATEIEGTSLINRSNASENCETSSIGRCLANLGFAAKGKRPSREEMGKANRQDPRKPLSKSDWEDLIGRLNACTSMVQLKAWSAYAATFAMPEGKRAELLIAFNSHRATLTKTSEVA